ncbi:molybdate ABC transporter permease subunit [Helicobacter typhlonius]|uniref:Molybdenum transport system permease n=1 Tax=Helicobacter typhlonius TaxID=76936 RepID=A0A099UHH8_9HELI|nr:molybdate ABC transporter permease subunit [Helicobacter typhlonius]TLD79589.1 molybdate ABC transporter permease subunit [Helicobacter typhlonius]CUU39273.1 Molybdenum transport system permease protein ModB (TC 3.A.1.8.1) [Helicobacter typhlonius]
MDFIETMRLTFFIAFLTTLILLPLGIVIGNFLAYSTNPLRPICEVLVWMPLVLPPSVLGFYLLITFSPQNILGAFLLKYFDIKLVFSFEGLILASVIFSLPFMCNPIKSALLSLPSSLKEASFTLGKGRVYTLCFVLLPNIKPALLLGCVTSFAHTIGEFGVVMMIGGNIPNQTRVASIAIYDEVESLNYTLAHQYAFTLFSVCFVLLLAIFYINKRLARGKQ